MSAAVSIEDRIADVFDASKRYVEARRQFLNAYNRAEARKALDDAWGALEDLFPVLPEHSER
jgi:hypothetical protein